MKYYINVPMISDHNDIPKFFIEIHAIAKKIRVVSTTDKHRIQTNMNIVDVSISQIDKFKSICKSHNIKFKAVIP